MAIDATGVDSWQRSRHYERCKNEFRAGVGLPVEKMPFAKVDVFVDTETLAIHDFVLRTKPRHDVLGVETMLKRTKVKDALVLATKAMILKHYISLHEKRGLSFMLLCVPSKLKGQKVISGVKQMRTRHA